MLGGGRIQHNPEEKTILVYGYSQVNMLLESKIDKHVYISFVISFMNLHWPSIHIHIHVCINMQGYGRANHQDTVDVLKTVYPDYKIEWSNDGY